MVDPCTSQITLPINCENLIVEKSDSVSAIQRKLVERAKQIRNSSPQKSRASQYRRQQLQHMVPQLIGVKSINYSSPHKPALKQGNERVTKASR